MYNRTIKTLRWGKNVKIYPNLSLNRISSLKLKFPSKLIIVGQEMFDFYTIHSYMYICIDGFFRHVITISLWLKKNQSKNDKVRVRLDNMWWNLHVNGVLFLLNVLEPRTYDGMCDIGVTEFDFRILVLKTLYRTVLFGTSACYEIFLLLWSFYLPFALTSETNWAFSLIHYLNLYITIYKKSNTRYILECWVVYK